MVSVLWSYRKKKLLKKKINHIFIFFKISFIICKLYFCHTVFFTHFRPKVTKSYYADVNVDFLLTRFSVMLHQDLSYLSHIMKEK